MHKAVWLGQANTLSLVIKPKSDSKILPPKPQPPNSPVVVKLVESFIRSHQTLEAPPPAIYCRKWIFSLGWNNQHKNQSRESNPETGEAGRRIQRVNIYIPKHRSWVYKWKRLNKLRNFLKKKEKKREATQLLKYFIKHVILLKIWAISFYRPWKVRGATLVASGCSKIIVFRYNSFSFPYQCTVQLHLLNKVINKLFIFDLQSTKMVTWKIEGHVATCSQGKREVGQRM